MERARHAESDVPLRPPGLHEERLTRAGSPPVGYALDVPRGYTREARVPLVLALHYGGEPFRGHGRGVVEALVAPALAGLGAVIVAPDALARDWGARVNEEAAMGLLDAVAAVYNVDRGRVVVTGFSMGGAGSWVYAARHAGVFSAALPVAGAPGPPPRRGEAPWRVPVFAVGSRRDTVMPVAPTVEAVEGLRRAGVRAEVVVLEDPPHYDVAAHVGGLARAVPWLQELWRTSGAVL